jgi:hypothetical protein
MTVLQEIREITAKADGRGHFQHTVPGDTKSLSISALLREGWYA